MTGIERLKALLPPDDALIKCRVIAVDRDELLAAILLVEREQELLKHEIENCDNYWTDVIKAGQLQWF